MQVFIYNGDLNVEDNFRLQAESFGASVVDNQFSLPPEMGVGHFQLYPNTDDFCIIDESYTLATNFFSGSKKTDGDRYFLTFSSSEVPENECNHVLFGDQSTSNIGSWEAAFFFSTHFDLMALQPAGFKTSMMLFSFSHRWLVELLGKENLELFFEDYMLYRAKAFKYFEINKAVKKLCNEIKVALRKGEDPKEIENTSKQLVSIYFTEMSQILRAISFSSFSDVDILALLRFVHNAGDSFFLEPSARGEIATQLGMSNSKFGTLFKDVYGKSYSEFLLGKRMEWATALLASGNVKVSDVAFTLGYENYSRFGDAFRNHTGILPSELLRVVKQA